MKKNKKRIEMLNREYDREQIALKLNRLEAIMNDPELSDSEKMRQANELDSIYDCGNNSRSIQEERIVDDIFNCHNSSMDSDGDYNGDLQFYNEPAPQVPQNDVPVNNTTKIAPEKISISSILDEFSETNISDKSFYNISYFIKVVKDAASSYIKEVCDKCIGEGQETDTNLNYRIAITGSNLKFCIDDVACILIMQYGDSAPIPLNNYCTRKPSSDSISAQDMYSIIMLVERIVYSVLVKIDTERMARVITIPDTDGNFISRTSCILYDILVADIVCELLTTRQMSNTLTTIINESINDGRSNDGFKGELKALSGFCEMIHFGFISTHSDDTGKMVIERAPSFFDVVEDSYEESAGTDIIEPVEEDFEESVEIDSDEITEEAWEKSEEFSEEEMEFESDEEYISEEDITFDDEDDSDDHIIMKPRY